MSERKVLNKYYPPDYDPSKVPRIKRKNKQTESRVAAPFNMRCTTCGNYIARGTKFNAKKETVEDEAYHKLLIYRLYIKCPRCMTPIIFRTDPKEQGYEMESGATENFRALKVAEQKAREEAEAEQEEEKIDPMKQLESRTKASRQQMEASEQIQQIRSFKHKIHAIEREVTLPAAPEVPAITHTGEDEISEEAKRLYLEGRKKAEISSGANSVGSLNSAANKPTNKRPSSSLLSGLRKKIILKPKASTSKDDKT